VEPPKKPEKRKAKKLKPVKESVVIYTNDFEGGKVGSEPGQVVGADAKKGAGIEITDKVAASGKHSIVIRDAKLERSWMPLWQSKVDEKNLLAGVVRFSFDVMVDKADPGKLNLMFRHYGDYPDNARMKAIFHLEVTGESAIKVGKESLKAINGVWHHVEVEFPQGLPGKRIARGVVTTPNGRERPFEIPCSSQDYVGLNWFGFAAVGEKGITYIDNVKIRITE
jgi:hypothetical protein